MFADALPAWVNTTFVRGSGPDSARSPGSWRRASRSMPDKLHFAEAEARIEPDYWQPFHDGLRD